MRRHHPCAVCPKPIGLGLLMCAPHWRLVPTDHQRQVVSAYGRFKGAAAEALPLIAHYRTARDAAVASAREALALDATGDLK